MIKQFIASSVIAASCFSAQFELSLPDIMNNFNYLIEGSQFNQDRLTCLLGYKDGCSQVLNEAALGIKAANNALYRAYLSGVICAVGHELFEKNIAPLLFDWNVLKQIIKMPRAFIQNNRQEWSGTSIYYRSNGNEIMYVKTIAHLKKKARYYFICNQNSLQEEYRVFQEADGHNLYLVNQNEDNPKVKCLLEALKFGVVFYHQFYYGFVNFLTKKAMIFDCSKQETREIDFSYLLPRFLLKYSKATVFFHDTLCCFTLVDERRSNKPIKLMFHLPQEPDLSSPLSYKTD